MYAVLSSSVILIPADHWPAYTIERLNDPNIVSFVDSLRDSLEGSHAIAPLWVWQPSAEQSTEGVLAERVRAKYHGGVVIIYRPYLRRVLEHGMTHPSQSVRPLVMLYAGKCVEALIRSTAAFHQVEPAKLVLSNPWGTAYA